MCEYTEYADNEVKEMREDDFTADSFTNQDEVDFLQGKKVQVDCHQTMEPSEEYETLMKDLEFA
jgi:hypothetical protein